MVSIIKILSCAIEVCIVSTLRKKGEKYTEMLVNFTKLYGFKFVKRKILSRFYFPISDCLCSQTFLALPSYFVLALLCNNSVSISLGHESPEINTVIRYVLHVSSLCSKWNQQQQQQQRRQIFQWNLRSAKMYRVGSRFTTGLRSRIFYCKSNRRKMSTI